MKKKRKIMGDSGELINLADQFAARGRRPNRKRGLSKPPIAHFEEYIDDGSVPAGEGTGLDVETIIANIDDEAIREELIEDAAQAIFDEYDQVAMTEFSGLTELERVMLRKKKDECLARLNDDEKREAYARFEAIINKPNGAA